MATTGDLVARGINAGELAFYYTEIDPDTNIEIGQEIYLGGTSDATLSISRSTIETTNKDVDSAQYITSFLTWEGSFSGFVTYSDSSDGAAGTSGYGNYSQLFDILNCRKLVKLRFRQITDRATTSCGTSIPTETSWPYFEGAAYLTDLEQTANNGEAVSFSGTFQGTGIISLNTNPIG